MSRFTDQIVKDLCAFDPISTSSSFRLPHDCYMIFVGRITSQEHFNKLTKKVKSREDSDDEEATNSSFRMMETEEMEYFLEFVSLADKAAVEKLADDRSHRFVYEDHFNSALLNMVKKKASFQQLKKVCRYYETKKDINVDKIMAEHEKRTALSTPYFTKVGLSSDDAQGAAFALSFYTGTKCEAVSRSASLVARQANGEVIEEKTTEEMNEAAIILYYLVKALSYIPYYGGYVTRACQLTDDELKVYVPGCLITWIQFSSSKKDKKVAETFHFASRNTYFKIYSLTGRPIRQFSNFQDEDEVLFLPHSTFFVLKHEVGHHGTQHTVYMRQVELGLCEWSVLWVDDQIFNKDWENKRHMESAATRALNLNVHFIPKTSTESALSFLRSPFGQRLKNKDTFRIVIDMNRVNEKPIHNAGARLIKAVRQMGFKNECMVFTSDQRMAQQIVQSELNSREQQSITVSTETDDLRNFVNFDQTAAGAQQSNFANSSKSNTSQKSAHSNESDVGEKPEGFFSGPTGTSPFYNACRENNINLVEYYLQTMSVEKINQIEPNGSTALHVASYRGYEKIVELLLQKGASHSIINKYNNTPFDEAKTDKIQQMIRRRMNKTRFVSDTIEWIISTNDADFQAHQYLQKLETYGKDPHFYQLILYIKLNYIEKDLKDVEDINKVKEYFDKAINKKDPVYLIRAYTAETGFYSTLNVHLAKLRLDNLTDNENLSRAYYIGIIARHPKFETLAYIGKVFRGMIINNDDLKKYKIGTKILTKTFSSSSKELNIALRFLRENSDIGDRLRTICTYEIRNQRTALDIEHISLFQYEKEVLILPYSAFKIIDIQINKDNSLDVEIKLKECEPW